MLEDMVASEMIVELANTEHQDRVLAGATTHTTLQQKFDKLVNLEITDKSTT